jgi:hypothetical protein
MNSLIEVRGRAIRIGGRLVRIARLDGDKYHFVDDPEPLLAGLRKCGTRIDLFTFLQKVDQPEPRFTYPMERDNLAVLPVSTYDHWLNHQIRSLPRNRTRQAEKKGVTFREVPLDDALVRGIHGIYNEVPVRQGRPYRHYGENIQTVYRETATYLDYSIFIGAFLGETLIGFVKIVTDEARTQANLMSIIAMIKHRDKAPTNALIAHSVRVCAERGIPFLVYQNFSYGSKGGDSLSHFKEINGFQRIDLPRYYVPLTPIGRVAFRLGMHHKFVDHLPQSLATKLRELRRSWHSRGSQPSAEAS